MAQKLYRSENEAIIGGVCGGLAEYFDLDVTIIRLIWAAAVLVGGFGGVLYIIAWVVIPTRSEHEIKVQGQREPKTYETTYQQRRVAGGIFIVVGLLLLMRNILPALFAWISWARLFPAILIIVGLVILFKE